jgi:hypothetical protein
MGPNAAVAQTVVVTPQWFQTLLQERAFGLKPKSLPLSPILLGHKSQSARPVPLENLETSELTELILLS